MFGILSVMAKEEHSRWSDILKRRIANSKEGQKSYESALAGVSWLT